MMRFGGMEAGGNKYAVVFKSEGKSYKEKDLYTASYIYPCRSLYWSSLRGFGSLRGVLPFQPEEPSVVLVGQICCDKSC